MDFPDHPVTGINFVAPTPDVVVCVDRCEPGVDPDYCIHGRTRCVKCEQWCWLGSETFEMVNSGKASPLCLECAILAEVASRGVHLGTARNHSCDD